ncbi:MAG: ATP-binding cassette domain-containing protein [Treponema sp.]|nr:ATP-binding cassette domain-containing protein [Treponema sp.]
MKQNTGTVPEGKNYSLFSNIVYIFSGLIRFRPRAIVLLTAGSITAYATVVVGNFLPALAVKTLTDGKGISRLLCTIGIGIAVFAACQFFSRMLTEVYAALCTRTRISVFFGRLEEKILSTDYENIEPTVMQRKLQRAQTAVYDGSNGIEYMMRAVPDLVIRFVGMASYAVLLAKRFSLQRKIELHYFLPQLSDSLFLFLRDLLAYSLLAVQTLNGCITIAEFTFNIALISGFFQWMNTWTISELFRVNIEVIQYQQYMDIGDRHPRGRARIVPAVGHSLSIDFEDVSFRYPGMTNDTLSHITLHIKAGEKLAIVGNYGAGKTTFIKLLCRLYDPTEGIILLNGIDIKKYDYSEYITLLGVVFQDFKLFAFTVAQNVAASVVCDRKRVRICLEEAGILDRVDRVENGLDTELYQNTEQGGEAQKIAIARALYKNSPVVILDEPTSALDPKSEYEIYKRFDSLVANKTSVYILHRMSSCRFCDTIVVFDKGHIVQTSSHAELMKDTGSLYYRLWTPQAKYYCE